MTGNSLSDDGLTAATLVQCTGDIVSRYVLGNRISQEEIPGLIQTVGRTLAGLGTDHAPTSKVRQKPAVPIGKSIADEYVICLEDGVKLKMLKRYLRRFGLTPEEYRRKWGLPFDYPMVAPSYAKVRSEFAKKNGLGKRVRAGRHGE